MTRLQSYDHADDEDLRAQVHFCAETGQIWLHEHRMLLVHAEAQACLRKELIDTLGMDRAQGLLTRMGYASGVRDAELARARAENRDDLDAFKPGILEHLLDGVQLHGGELLGALAQRPGVEFVVALDIDAAHTGVSRSVCSADSARSAGTCQSAGSAIMGLLA